MKILNFPSQYRPGAMRQPVQYRLSTLRQPSLLLCLVLDFIGMASYAVPFIGEFADIVWAPISGLLFFLLFGGWKGAMGGMFSIIEEILPGTDAIPTFTIMWFMRNAENKRRINGSR
jgi:hypothetical protein